MSLPVTMHEVFEPVELIHTPAGEQVFDLGQEITGLFTLNVHAPYRHKDPYPDRGNSSGG